MPLTRGILRRKPFAAFSVGFANQSAKVASDTLVQREINDDYLGRVFALFDVAVNVALVSGIVAVAFTSPESGIAPIIYVVIGVLVAANAAWYWRHRERV